MTFKSDGLSKLEYGSYLAAALSHLMLRQNDAVGLVLFDREVRASLPPRRPAVAVPPDPRTCSKTRRRGADTDVGAILHTVAESIKRRGLVILISDLIDDEAKIANGLQHFRHNNHEVVVFQVMDDAELTFPWDRITRFKDLEGAGRVHDQPEQPPRPATWPGSTRSSTASSRPASSAGSATTWSTPSSPTTCSWRPTWRSGRGWA